MILLAAILAGLVAGLALARWRRQPYQAPNLQYLWLVIIAFLPQVIFTALRNLPNGLVAVSLVASQILLLVFAWLNRHTIGMPILICGVALNLLVMASNGGFMPVSPQTAGRLVSESRLLDFQLGSRIGAKDILLLPQNTHFEWLADRILPPAWFPFQAAFSLGDIFIAIGVFWMLAQFTNRGTQT